MTTTEPKWTRLTLRMPARLHSGVKAKAESQHISLNSFIVRALSRASADRPSRPQKEQQ